MNNLFRIVNLPKSLDSVITSQLHQDIQCFLNTGVKIVLLNLKNVELINSSGLMFLAAALRIVRNAGGKLFICSINEQVKIVFELTGMDEVFDIFTSLEEFNNTVINNTTLKTY